MQEDGYRAYLLHRLSTHSRASYLSNLRCVERTLSVDIDTINLTDDCIVALLRKLRDADIPVARVSDCGSTLRLYARFVVEGRDLPSQPPGQPHSRPVPVAPEAPTRTATGFNSLPSVARLSVPELMQLYARILAELRTRNVTRTANGPVGDYAEMLFQRALGWTLESNSKAGYDAVDLVGTRYQIKARRVHEGAGVRQLSAIRRLPDRNFDVLAALLFDADLAVLRAVLIPYSVVTEHARWVEHVNGWRLTLSDRLCNSPAVRDVTPTRKAATAF